MTRSTRRGRRMKPPANPLGALIAERLAADGISFQVFADRLGVSRATVWRLLHAKTSFTHRISLVDICAALELNGEERAGFLYACASQGELVETLGGLQALPSAAASGSPVPDTMAGSEAETDLPAPTRQLLDFLTRRLDALDLSYSEFAGRVGVNPSTIIRLLRGEIKRTHEVSPDSIARALQFSPVDRRTFLRLAFESGLFAVTVPVRRPAGPFAVLERMVGITLDEIELEVIELRRRRNQGEVMPAFDRAQQLFTQLFDHTPHQSALMRSPELARVKLLVAFEYCEAQAAALGWYEREPRMIRTLDRMQHEVIQYFPPGQFASEVGHLINLRAPLYRRCGGRSQEAAYHEGIDEFTWALDHAMPHIHEPTLHVELLRNRAHTHLLHGDVRKWRADLETADRVAIGIRGEAGEQFRGLVTYSWGEGYERVVALPNLPNQARKRYIQEALDCLGQGEVAFLRYPLWHGYALLAGIAQAQCLAWRDSDEALRRLVELRKTAQRIYPSLEAKIERAQAGITHK
jgi:transcriptional regulator with XRE-family HTH domain